MPIDKNILDILVCPVTKEKLVYDEKRDSLISESARLSYPIRNGIPIMLPEEAEEI